MQSSIPTPRYMLLRIPRPGGSNPQATIYIVDLNMIGVSYVPLRNGVAHRRPHIRFHWGTTNATWDLWCGVKNNGALVILFIAADNVPQS